MKVIFPIIKLNYCLWYSWFGYNLSPMISYECEVKIASDSAALGKKDGNRKDQQRTNQRRAGKVEQILVYFLKKSF